MKKLYCFGKEDFCDYSKEYIKGWHPFCNGCDYYDGSGGEYRDTPVTNADRIDAMTIDEKAEFISSIAYGRKTPWSDQFAKKFCDNCPTTEYKSECYREPMHLHECDFTDGKCPNGNEIVWWLQQPAEDETI